VIMTQFDSDIILDKVFKNFMKYVTYIKFVFYVTAKCTIQNTYHICIQLTNKCCQFLSEAYSYSATFYSLL